MKEREQAHRLFLHEIRTKLLLEHNDLTGSIAEIFSPIVPQSFETTDTCPISVHFTAEVCEFRERQTIPVVFGYSGQVDEWQGQDVVVQRVERSSTEIVSSVRLVYIAYDISPIKMPQNTLFGSHVFDFSIPVGFKGLEAYGNPGFHFDFSNIIFTTNYV